MNENAKKFVSEVILELIENKISVNLYCKKRIKCDENDVKSYVSGFFSDYDKNYAISTGKPQKDWLQTFVHEYCHFLQWKEQCKYWTILDSKINLDDVLFNNDGKTFSRRDINSVCIATRNLELDCEKRSVKIIKNRKLNIDISEYIQEANAYIFLYNIINETQKWPKKSPYETYEIVDLMPMIFLDSYSKTPEKYRKLVLKHCY